MYVAISYALSTPLHSVYMVYVSIVVVHVVVVLLPSL